MTCQLSMTDNIVPDVFVKPFPASKGHAEIEKNLSGSNTDRVSLQGTSASHILNE